MNIQELKVGDLVTWKNKSGLVPGPEPIFTVTKIDVEDKVVHILVPHEGINSTRMSFLRVL